MASSLVLSSLTPNSCLTTDPAFTIVVNGSNFTPDSVIYFGGTALTTTYTGANSLSGDVTPNLYPYVSLGGVSVYIQNSQGQSNIVLFSVSQNSPITSNQIDSLANSTTTLSKVQVTGDENTYLIEVNDFQTYTIQDNDTLQGIAARLLGDASQWFTIAIINNLRYPFISNDTTNAAGVTNGTAILTRAASAGDTVIYVSNISNQIIEVGSVLYFYLNNPDSNGVLRQLSDDNTVVSVNPTFDSFEEQIGLDDQINNNYPIGTSIDVLSTYQNTTSTVVGTGDNILIPSTVQNTSLIQTSNVVSISQIDAILGTDLSLDTGGFLSSDDNGDLDTVTGIENLNQALNDRLECELGELDYHPTYGNALLDYIGLGDTPALSLLANTKISSTLMADPRVNSVNYMNSTIKGDTLIVNGEVYVNILNVTAPFQFTT